MLLTPSAFTSRSAEVRSEEQEQRYKGWEVKLNLREGQIDMWKGELKEQHDQVLIMKQQQRRQEDKLKQQDQQLQRGMGGLNRRFWRYVLIECSHVCVPYVANAY